MKKKSKLIIYILITMAMLCNLIILTNFTLSNQKITEKIPFHEDSDQFNPLSSNWSPMIKRPISGGPRGLFVGDANNDGYNDIVTSSIGLDAVCILLWSVKNHDWDPLITRSVGVDPYHIYIGDANNDGYNDIVSANWGDDSISILLWNPSSVDWDPQIKKSVGTRPRGISIGDLNNDGYNDILSSDQDDNTISIFIWDPISLDWESRLTKSGGPFPVGVDIGDLNEDGYNDIVIADAYSNTVSIYLWNSSIGDWNPRLTRTTGWGPMGIVIGDANNDGYNDIVAATYDEIPYSVSVLIWNTTLDDWNLKKVLVDHFPWGVSLGDTNGDGFNDIVTANRDVDTISILLWNNDLKDWDKSIPRVVGPPFEPHIEDANNDGHKDIVIAVNDMTATIFLYWDYGLRPIKLISPLNRTYTRPIEGYYPATYGFESDSDGTSPVGWINQDASQCSSQIISGLEGHKKILRQIDDNSGYAAVLNHTFKEARDHGTIEFYSRITIMSAGARMWWDLNSPSGQEIWFTMGDSKVHYFNGSTWHDIIPSGLMANTWYHFSVRWRNTGAPAYEDLAEGEWKIYIDGVEYGNYKLIFDNNMTSVNLESGASPSGHITYWDAIGLDWENAYNIGDNMNEGLFLSFELQPQVNWTGYSMDGQTMQQVLGNYTIPFPEDGVHSVQIFGEDIYGEDYSSMKNYFTIDTKDPFIDIESPAQDEVFGTVAPFFNISIDEANLVSTWYSLDGGITNITFTDFNGYIHQGIWDSTPEGQVDIRFYAQDITGNITYQEVSIIKSILRYLHLKITSQSFSADEFDVTFYIYNDTGGGIDFATIGVWWNNTDVSSDVLNLGNGVYFISLEPITVSQGEDPISLHVQISASGYQDLHLDTTIAVDPESLQKISDRNGGRFPIEITLIIVLGSTGAIIAVGIMIYQIRKRKRTS